MRQIFLTQESLRSNVDWYNIKYTKDSTCEQKFYDSLLSYSMRIIILRYIIS